MIRLPVHCNGEFAGLESERIAILIQQKINAAHKIRETKNMLLLLLYRENKLGS